MAESKPVVYSHLGQMHGVDVYEGPLGDTDPLFVMWNGQLIATPFRDRDDPEEWFDWMFEQGMV